MNFGNLQIVGTDGTKTLRAVAMKNTGTTDVFIEIGNMLRLNRLGTTAETEPLSPLSFKPYGIAINKNGNLILVSEFDPSVRSFDNIFWCHDRQPHKLEYLRAMEYAAITLGFLHSQRITHGDARVRNIATDGEGVRIIDLESMRFHDDNNPDEYLKNAIMNDLETFFDSLFLERNFDLQTRHALIEAFLQDYDCLREHDECDRICRCIKDSEISDLFYTSYERVTTQKRN